VPFTLARLFEDGLVQIGDRKHCRDCGVWMYPFEGPGRRRWFELIERDGKAVYIEHNIHRCDARRKVQGRPV
jgi:hypothetical protein